MTIARSLTPLFAFAVLGAAGCAADDGATSYSGQAGTETDGNGTGGDGGGPGGDGGDGGDGANTSGGSGGTDAGDQGDADADTDAGPDSDGEETGERTGLDCLNDQFVNGGSPGPDYTEFDVPVGKHCQGTSQQDITGVERIVFIGDSVTVGTPPVAGSQVYRSIVAVSLADTFGLEAPSSDWQGYNLINGDPIEAESGSFAQCARWGGRNDDLQGQLEQCFGPEDLDLRTLIVMTSGGNDVSAMVTDAIDGAPVANLFEDLELMVEHHREAMEWIVEEGRFPNGVFVVNANVFEFTDYTAQVTSCPSSVLAGFSSDPPNTDILLGSLNLINEEYMQVAIDTGTDIAFMFETMCGHGFNAADPSNVCYRGAGNENWFDGTCIHPTPAGHAAVAEMFLNVITQ